MELIRFDLTGNPDNRTIDRIMPIPDIQEVLDKLQSGATAEVLPTLTYLAELLPTGLTTQVLLARTYEAEHDWWAALSAWQAVHFLMPNSPQAHQGIQRCIQSLSEGPEEQVEEPASISLHDSEEVGDRFIESREPDMQPAVIDEKSDEDTVDSTDLDRLISELERARIVPDPALEANMISEQDDDLEDVVSETLARIYAAQQQFGEAARVYDSLARQNPARMAEFHRKADDMRARASNL